MIDKNILEKDIIPELGLEHLSKDKQIALLDEMSKVVQKRITLRVLEEMPEEEKDEFERFLDNSSEPEQISDFLQKVIPNFFEIVQEEIVKLKSEMINEFSE